MGAFHPVETVLKVGVKNRHSFQKTSPHWRAAQVSGRSFLQLI
jgi:hypothetical protein